MIGRRATPSNPSGLVLHHNVNYVHVLSMSIHEEAEPFQNIGRGRITQTIPQDTFLTTEDLKDLLRGKIKLKRLVRDFGLRGFANGYWSNALIVSLDRACGILVTSTREFKKNKNRLYL